MRLTGASGNVQIRDVTNRVGAVRKERGMRREELAVAVGVSVTTIGLIERGKTNPSVRLALDIAAALKTNVSDLFGEAA